MGTWGEVEVEILNTQTPEGALNFDGVRRGYLKRLAEYTEHNVIVYEATFSPPQGADPTDFSISLDPDMGAFMEAVHSLPRENPVIKRDSHQNPL